MPQEAQVRATLDQAREGRRLDLADLLPLTDLATPQLLIPVAAKIRDQAHHERISFSRKIFIPLTELCRNVCHYCTFAKRPAMLTNAYMDPDQVVALARRGRDAGCWEALFTLGDRPELRYSAARRQLEELGHKTTLSYLKAVAGRVLTETGLLPHLNAGVMSRSEMEELREVSVSMGLMLESTSQRLCAPGGPHYGSPDKHPDIRLQTMRHAGELKIPFTTGLLIGIGETRAERIDALLAIRALNDEFGHIQEVIIQNFCSKPNTRMAHVPDVSEDELLWTIALARIILGPQANIQAPPNLAPGALETLIAAGINDWGGVSPVTLDHVNPERPWPNIAELRYRTGLAGKQLVERTAVYPDYVQNAASWQSTRTLPSLLAATDSGGYARTDHWKTGTPTAQLPQLPRTGRTSDGIHAILDRACAGVRLKVEEIERLFMAHGADLAAIIATANTLRETTAGNDVTYVINRNINYTNICKYRCGFCAFSKGRTHQHLRGAPYELSLDIVSERVKEAHRRGATEVCLQGGIHPAFTGNTYLDIVRAAKSAVPQMHVHAFSPLEIWHGAQTARMELRDFLLALKDAGLGSLPGTAAEILDDEVRSEICPDKLNTEQWLKVIETAHTCGLMTTATIMFGHLEKPIHWARHLLSIRDLQARTRGFTEFVPLPFVAQEAPLFLKGRAHPGPTFREAILMHAIARLTLFPHIVNIQASWVKLGPQGVSACLQAGANDLGGTLMDESITRAAGGAHGQEWNADDMIKTIKSIGRGSKQRTTLYGEIAADSQRQYAGSLCGSVS